MNFPIVKEVGELTWMDHWKHNAYRFKHGTLRLQKIIAGMKKISDEGDLNREAKKKNLITDRKDKIF